MGPTRPVEIGRRRTTFFWSGRIFGHAKAMAKSAIICAQESRRLAHKRLTKRVRYARNHSNSPSERLENRTQILQKRARGGECRRAVRKSGRRKIRIRIVSRLA